MQFSYAKFGSRNYGKTAVLVILFIIYDNLCNCLLSPSPRNNNLHCMLICIYIYILVFYFVFSTVLLGRSKFNKFNCLLALCMFNCLYKFRIIQYILKFKCICVCIFSYCTYSSTEYSDSLFNHNTLVLYCLVIFTIWCFPLGSVLYTPEGEYSLSTQ